MCSGTLRATPFSVGPRALDLSMGSCLSCLQDDTRRAENARIIPMGQEFSHYEVRRTRFSHTRTHFSSHPLHGLQRPKQSDEPEPKVAADDNPYGAKSMSLVLRMNRAEQNAGDFKVAAITIRPSPSPSRKPAAAQVGCDLDDFNVVTKVKAGSPAARAGMQVSDQITDVDGEPLDGRKVQDLPCFMSQGAEPATPRDSP